jgi:uncharacterized protein (UPF0332 family)
MRPEILALARYRMARSREAFDDGLSLLGKGSFSGAINRFYYAGFYAARALLATKELDSSKHSGVISLFQQHFVKTGMVSAQLSKALPRSFEKRQDSDYEDYVSVTQPEVESTRDEILRFIDECDRVLATLIEESGEDQKTPDDRLSDEG